MRQDKINILLTALNSKRTGYRAGWVEGHCPLAPWNHANGKDSHPSFGIKEDLKKKSICKCLSCGFGGDLTDLLFRVAELKKKSQANGYNLPFASVLVADEFEGLELDPSSIPEYGETQKKIDDPFPEYWLDSFKMASQFKEAVAYLEGRGVNLSMAKELDLRFDPIQRRIGFPFRNFKGALMGVQGRAIDKGNELRYYQYGFHGKRNTHAWMGEHRVNFDYPLVLVEGPFDFTSVFRVYENVAASFTSGLSVEKIKRISDASEIITFYDYGAGGDAARASLKKHLPKTPITHIKPTKEQDDAGNMTVEEVVNHLKGKVKLKPH